MKLIRIFQPGYLNEGEIINLNEAAVHHLSNVLRVSLGVEIILFNGEGFEYLAEITGMDKKNIEARVFKKCEIERESPLSIELLQGISRGERMDVVMQKSVELGVKEITPLFTARCEVKLTPERLVRRIEHWQKIIIGACEQSGRLLLPKLNIPVPLTQWLRQPKQALKLVCVPGGEKTLAQLPSEIHQVILLIGPEGGLTDAEVEQAFLNDFIPLSLGPRILRTETATIAALSLLQAKWGDINS